MQPGLITSDLEVRYGDVVGVSGVNLYVPLGASLAVVGANGSGKSTLLGAIAGLHKISKGTVTVAETPALVLQATEVEPGLPITVRDAVKIGRYRTLGLLRRFQTSDHEAINAALDRMQIAHLEALPLNQLSGGQRQRVLIAQGLVQASKVLLLDEPMAGLDLPSRQIVLDVIADEVAAGCTVVTTTHSLDDAAECDLALLLSTSPVAVGAPSDVLTEGNLASIFGSQLGAECVEHSHLEQARR